MVRVETQEPVPRPPDRAIPVHIGIFIEESDKRDTIIIIKGKISSTVSELNNNKLPQKRDITMQSQRIYIFFFNPVNKSIKIPYLAQYHDNKLDTQSL